MHAFPGVDLLLDRHLVFGAGLEAAADADIQPFGVLTEDGEVDVCRRSPLQRAEALVEQPHRAVVHVKVQLEARPEQDVACVSIVGDPGIAERADEHRIELAEEIVAVRGQRHAGLQVVIGAPGKMLEPQAEGEPLLDGGQHLDRLAGHVLPDPIPGDDADVHRSSHPSRLRSVWF